MSESKAEIVEKQDEAYQIFEKYDEKAIMDEMHGIYVETLVYQFEDGRGKLVTGLSIKGIYELTKSLVRRGYDVVCEEAKIIEETEGEYKSSCKATFTAPNGKMLTTFGYSKANKFYSKGSANEFAYVQALSKAQRNALRTLIPERQATEFIKTYLEEKKEGRVKYFKPTTSPARPSSPPPVSPLARALPETPPATEKLAEAQPKTELTMLRFPKDTPAFAGTNAKMYGPYQVESIGNVPTGNIKSLVQGGYAMEVFGGDGKKAAETQKTVGPQETVKKEEEKAEGEKNEEEKKATWPLRASDGSVYGDIGKFEDGLTVKFDPPIDMQNPQTSKMVNTFLVSRVFKIMKDKVEAEGKPFAFDLNESDIGLESINVTGEVDEKQIGDLVRQCSWAAMRAKEHRDGGS